MQSDNKKNNFWKQNFWLLICSVIFMLSIVAIRVINANDISLEIGKFKVSSGGVSGIISQLLVLMTIWIEVCVKNSHKFCKILLSLLAVNTFLPIIFKGNFSSLPGIAMVIGGFVTLHVIDKFIKKISANNEFLEDIAHTDYLTGLPNRRHFMKYLEELENGTDKFALVFIDIDNFKKINDTLGHDFGDAVLCKIHELWKEVKEENDYVSRLGGDEFALIVKNCKDSECLKNHVTKFKDAINRKITIDGQSVFISASFGVICSLQCREHKLMLKYADIAMYNAKSSSEKLSFFKDEMKSEVESLVTTESMVRYALENNGFYLMYQPQFDTETKKLRGFETLIRMKDKNGNTVRPDKFIAVAEQSNLIVDIDKWVLKTALSTFKKFFEQYKVNFLVSINISVNHIQNDSFIDNVINVLNATGFSPENLEVEVTESVFITSIDEVIEKLNILRNMGITIALDDFGTGYASLSNLKNLPVDLLKIDKSFIDDVENGEDEKDFVEAIISMGHIMHYSVISEGVETVRQIEILKQLGCDHIQGFCWGKPLDAYEAEKVIIENGK